MGKNICNFTLILIKATHCGDKTRENLRNNLNNVSVQDDQDTETEQIKSDFRDWQVDFKKNAGSLQYYSCLSIIRCFYGNCNVFRGDLQLPLPETLRKDVCFILPLTYIHIYSAFLLKKVRRDNDTYCIWEQQRPKTSLYSLFGAFAASTYKVRT